MTSLLAREWTRTPGHKGGMPFLIFGMMLYFDNFSLAAWLYLALHGSYGLIWVMKDYTFPDASLQRKVTLLSFIIPWLVVIQPYRLVACVKPQHWVNGALPLRMLHTGARMKYGSI